MKITAYYGQTIICLILGIVSSCHNKQQKSTIPILQKKTATTRSHFGNIKEVYLDTSSIKWTDRGSFWWLYFEPGKVVFDFNPSCGYWFPVKFNNGKAIFYWAKNMNCTFNRGLDKSFKGVKSPEPEKKFGEITLVNDSTLYIDYYYKEWVKKINEAERESIDTLFPVQFTVMKLAQTK